MRIFREFAHKGFKLLRMSNFINAKMILIVIVVKKKKEEDKFFYNFVLERIVIAIRYDTV